METWMATKGMVEKKGKQAFNNGDGYNGNSEDDKRDGRSKRKAEI